MKILALVLCLIFLTGCTTLSIKDVKKGALPPSCAICQHSVRAAQHEISRSDMSLIGFGKLAGLTHSSASHQSH